MAPARPSVAARLLLGAVLTVGTLIAAHAGIAVASGSGFPVVAASDPTYPQRVDFVTACRFVKTAPDDPIVFPGMPGMSHDHTFSSNVGVTASSTPQSLTATGTTCSMSKDHASYWMPTLLNDGKKVVPYASRAYYRAGTTSGASIVPVPFGLRVIAGSSTATTPQKAGVAGFQCRDATGNTVAKQALPPRCPVGDFLEASVVFPNCWDGVHLDSADHRSHLSYAVDLRCDSAHPVQIPQLTFAERFPVDSTRGTVTLSAGNSPMTLHADFMNAWDPATMAMLVRSCINASVACEDVSDTRLPPLR